MHIASTLIGRNFITLGNIMRVNLFCLATYVPIYILWIGYEIL